jgi:hypothetical protein
MMHRRAFVALGLALALASCGYRSEEFRYRMTVEVDTPQGLRTGSSVIEVEVSDPGPNSLPEAGINTKVRGEAVSVDMPDGNVLFVLLSSADAAAGYAYQALKPSRFGGDYAFIEKTREMKRMRRVGALRCPRTWYDRGRRRVGQDSDIRTDCPILVRFRDLRDPRSVERVDPANLADSFGDGISLRRITIQITSDPVTYSLADRLPWFDSYLENHFDGTTTVLVDLTTDNLAARLSSESFSTERPR